MSDKWEAEDVEEPSPWSLEYYKSVLDDTDGPVKLVIYDKRNGDAWISAEYWLDYSREDDELEEGSDDHEQL